MSDFWAAQTKKYGLRKDQLQHIIRQQGVLTQISQQKELKSKRKVVKKHRVWASGAGRQTPFPQLLSDLKVWLSLSEFLSRLQVAANKARTDSAAPEISSLRKQELLLEAKNLEARKQKILSRPEYKKKEVKKLIQWLDAKYVSAKLVSTISQTETGTRCMLTWQEFDHPWSQQLGLSGDTGSEYLPGKRVGKLIDPACGYYVLDFMEMEIRLFRGEWLSEHPDQMYLSWLLASLSGGSAGSSEEEGPG